MTEDLKVKALNEALEILESVDSFKCFTAIETVFSCIDDSIVSVENGKVIKAKVQDAVSRVRAEDNSSIIAAREWISSVLLEIEKDLV